MTKAPKKKPAKDADTSANPWANIPAIDYENDPYWKSVREATKDALTCPHCDQMYFLSDAHDEETGKVFCPECDTEIKSKAP